jgi:hypothetical protein
LLRRTIQGMMGPRVIPERLEFMNKNNNATWITKHGTRRVRNDAPTLDQAIVAAQGLTDNLSEQAEIAAALMGLPLDEVRAALVKMGPAPKEPVQTVAFAGPASAPRTVVVERKPSRRIGAPADRTGRPVSIARSFSMSRA